MKMKNLFKQLIKLCLLVSTSVWAGEKQPSVAFYYGAHPPFNDLRAFDVAVVEPEHVSHPRQHLRPVKGEKHELFAYISLGEVHPSRAYYSKLPKKCLAGKNEAWGSRVVNQACPEWPAFFLDTIIAPLWSKGWRGFFVDTLDSYQLFATTDAMRLQQTQAMVAILRELKNRHPEAKLILNRGFELLPDIAHITYAVAAESLFQGFDAGKQTYGAVSEEDRAWLLERMTKARDSYDLPVISIDYVNPNLSDDKELARETVSRIREQGFIPWVADGHLMTIGLGLND
jgi:uncharacterized protein (TIGR01370 family)